jgi:hypothetical protein
MPAALLDLKSVPVFAVPSHKIPAQPRSLGLAAGRYEERMLAVTFFKGYMCG